MRTSSHTTTKAYCPYNTANLKGKLRSLPKSGWAGCKLRPQTKYKEYDRRLKEQFINGLDDETIIVEIIKELTALKETSEVSSEQTLMGAQRIEAQRAQKDVLDNIRDFK